MDIIYIYIEFSQYSETLIPNGTQPKLSFREITLETKISSSVDPISTSLTDSLTPSLTVAPQQSPRQAKQTPLPHE